MLEIFDLSSMSPFHETYQYCSYKKMSHYPTSPLNADVDVIYGWLLS